MGEDSRHTSNIDAPAWRYSAFDEVAAILTWGDFAGAPENWC